MAVLLLERRTLLEKTHGLTGRIDALLHALVHERQATLRQYGARTSIEVKARIDASSMAVDLIVSVLGPAPAADTPVLDSEIWPAWCDEPLASVVCVVRRTITYGKIGCVSHCRLVWASQIYKSWPMFTRRKPTVGLARWWSARRGGATWHSVTRANVSTCKPHVEPRTTATARAPAAARARGTTCAETSVCRGLGAGRGWRSS